MMQRVKIFKSIESELFTLESEVNAWIEQEQPRIISITGNIAPQTLTEQPSGFTASDVLMIVLYEVNNG